MTYNYIYFFLQQFPDVRIKCLYSEYFLYKYFSYFLLRFHSHVKYHTTTKEQTLLNPLQISKLSNQIMFGYF